MTILCCLHAKLMCINYKKQIQECNICVLLHVHALPLLKVLRNVSSYKCILFKTT